MFSAANTSPKHTFHFVLHEYQGELEEYKGRYYVEAKALEGSSYFPRAGHNGGDLLFNLSGVLGNKDGKFDWGRSFFEETITGEPEIVEQPTVGGVPIYKLTDIPQDKKVTNVRCVLKAKLLNLQGVPVDATIDLHEHLEVREYELDGKKYHRLTDRSGRPSGRTLVLCFDGTSNHFSDKNTNVVKLAELLKKDDPENQMVYYQTGVGTYSPPGLITPVGLTVASLLDQGVAWYLYQHVIDGYRFLMQTYRAGDKIVLFGFSRGAFTARALAGMLHCVGLLPAHNSEHVAFAYQVYKNVKKGSEKPSDRQKKLADKRAKRLFDWGWLDPSEVEPEDFKKAFSRPVVIDFVGVWDTVASVGALWMREFRWIEYNPSILVFRQALALDERRGNFIPSLWDHRYTENKFQDAREVWFRGEHCDVGGGSAGPSPKDKSSGDNNVLQRIVRLVRRPSPPSSELSHSMLSNISLRWMVRQMLQFNTGILLDPVAVRDYQEKGILETPLVNKMAPNLRKLKPLNPQSSDQLDEEDVKKKIYDSIGCSLLWNILEYLVPNQKLMKVWSGPTEKYTKGKLVSTTTRCPNAKAGRSIYFGGVGYPIFIHKSVTDFMDDPNGKKYTPRATWHGYPKGDPEYPGKDFTYPPIEGVAPGLKPVNAQLRLNTVKAEGKNKTTLWAKFLGGCVIAAAVCLIVTSIFPKSWKAMLSSSIESFIWSWL